MNSLTPAPRGLGWTVTPFGRLLALALAVISILVSVYVGFRYVGLVDCLKERDSESRERTAAIAQATDLERIADLKLLRAPSGEARQAAVTAREATDRVRSAYPAPDQHPCG